jgi:nucleotide-binding universal stress UspA family protein
MRILVPVDGSAPSLRAVKHALALVDGGEIILVNVQSRDTLGTSDFAAVVTVEEDRRLAERRSRQALRRAIRLCRDAGVRFAARAEIGPVAETIAALARREGADQIVIGSRGLKGLRRLLLGSVATRVAELARVPVTIVK